MNESMSTTNFNWNCVCITNNQQISISTCSDTIYVDWNNFFTRQFAGVWWFYFRYIILILCARVYVHCKSKRDWERKLHARETQKGSRKCTEMISQKILSYISCLHKNNFGNAAAAAIKKCFKLESFEIIHRKMKLPATGNSEV